MRVLFICSRNRLRSPSAEAHFSARAGWETASAGLNKDSPVPVSHELLQWADRIFVMEAAQGLRLKRRFASSLKGKEVRCLGIPDRYRFMEPALLALLEKRVGPH